MEPQSVLGLGDAAPLVLVREAHPRVHVHLRHRQGEEQIDLIGQEARELQLERRSAAELHGLSGLLAEMDDLDTVPYAELVHADVAVHLLHGEGVIAAGV